MRKTNIIFIISLISLFFIVGCTNPPLQLLPQHLKYQVRSMKHETGALLRLTWRTLGSQWMLFGRL